MGNFIYYIVFLLGINPDIISFINHAIYCWNTNYFHAVGQGKNVTAGIVSTAHAAGTSVLVWTPDTKADMQKLIQAGVDGITTNRPDILLSLLNR